MDYAEMDFANIVAVVIEKSDDAVGVVSGEVQLFINLTFYSGEIGFAAKRACAFINRIDMAADSDGALGMETAFASAFATGIMEVMSVVVEKSVGDDLFERGVFFSRASVHEEVVGGVENGFEIASDVSFNSLK